jgi:hypothetical protein
MMQTNIDSNECCQQKSKQQDSHEDLSHHAQHSSNNSLIGLTTSATLHCLTGCAIGELAGLMIGVSLGLGVWNTMILAAMLGFLSGYTLGLLPLVKQGNSWAGAFKTIWLGETISIAVMEFTMNFTDYHVGGVSATSIFEFKFWLGYLVALPAGFIAAWPVNYWLLKKSIKQKCH